MSNALVIAATVELEAIISEVLRNAGFENIKCTKSIEGAKAFCRTSTPSIVFINMIQGGTLAVDFIKDVARKSAVVVLTKEALVEETEEALVETQALVLGKPISRQVLVQSVKIAGAVSKKLEVAHRETQLLKQRIEDLKLIDRAKCLLVANLKMDEKQAHRYIQKRAMDTRLPQRDIAEEILKTYEY